MGSEFINTTWIATTPRTGSMWATNIVREILKKANVEVLPKIQFKNDPDWIDLYLKEAIVSDDSRSQYVLKVHTVIKTDLPRSRYITTVRNPFDVCASFYEFMGADVRRAIQTAKMVPKLLDHYQKVDSQKLLVIRYEDIEQHSARVIENIAKFLGVYVSIEAVEEINKLYSKENIKSIIRNNDLKLMEKIINSENIEKNEIVMFEKNKVRSFDQNTGFQTKHVSERNSGEWRRAFSEVDGCLVENELKGIAKDLGYDY